MRKDILARKDDISRWISENRSKAFMCRELRCKPLVLENCLRSLNITYKGNMGLKGVPHVQQRLSALEYMQSDSVHFHKLKKKLIDEGLKEDKCESCGLTEWMGEKMPTELHHKDGNRYHNTLDNFAVLCCNCHKLADDALHGRNKKKRRPLYVKKYENLAAYHQASRETYHNAQQQYIPLVMASGIDFGKFGWVTKLSAIINQRPQKVHQWMKRFMPDFYHKECFKRIS